MRRLLTLSVCLAACSNETTNPAPDAGSPSAPDAGIAAGTPDAGVDTSRDFYLASWGSASNNVWIAGLGAIRHFDGQTWDRLPVTIDGGGTAFLGLATTLWGSGAADVWTSVAWGGRNDFLHFDGVNWNFMALDGSEPMMNGLWGFGPNDIWAVGGPPAEMLHWNGTAWAPDHSALAAYATGPYMAAWGDAAGALWVVGASGSFAQGSKGMVLRRAADQWQLQTTASQVLYAIRGSSPKDLWAVGDVGLVLHYDGTAWTTLTSGTTARLFALWVSGPGDVWIAGEAGTLLHFDGTRLIQRPSGTVETLLTIRGGGPTDLWVGGTKGTILHFTR